MSCPTCDHTMQGITPATFWCPRCGTIRNGEIYVPSLISRCNMFAMAISPPPPRFKPDAAKEEMLAAIYNIWRKLGIEESIHLPSERPA